MITLEPVGLVRISAHYTIEMYRSNVVLPSMRFLDCTPKSRSMGIANTPQIIIPMTIMMLRNMFSVRVCCSEYGCTE